MSEMTEFKHDLNMEDSGNSCGSSVVSEIFSDSDCVLQVSDLEGENESHVLQVGKKFMTNIVCWSVWGGFESIPDMRGRYFIEEQMVLSSKLHEFCEAEFCELIRNII